MLFINTKDESITYLEYHPDLAWIFCCGIHISTVLNLNGPEKHAPAH